MEEFLSSLKFSQPTLLILPWEKVRNIKSKKKLSDNINVIDIAEFPKPVIRMFKTFSRIETLIREIQILHVCDHPNILPLNGISFNPDSPYEIYFFTPLTLRSLRDLIGKSRPPLRRVEFDEVAKQKIIFGISAGLLYLSSKNIINGELTLDYILLDGWII